MSESSGMLKIQQKLKTVLHCHTLYCRQLKLQPEAQENEDLRKNMGM